MAVTIKSAAKVREEDRIIEAAVSRAKKQPRTTDRTDWEKAKTAFRALCMQFRAMYPEKYPNFRGGFEDITAIMMDEEVVNNQEAFMLLQKLNYVDMALEYEADALCIDPPNSWKSIWYDELGIEDPCA